MSPVEFRRGALHTGALVFLVLDFFSGGVLTAPIGWLSPSLTPLRRLAGLVVLFALGQSWRRFAAPKGGWRIMAWPTPALAALGVLGIVTRFATLGWDQTHGPDGYEALFIRPVLNMLGTGDLNHRYHEYPGLFLYLLVGAFVLAFMIGISHRVGINLADMPALVFLKAGRLMVAASSLATVLFTVILGRYYGGMKVGILAAFLVCLSPLEIDTSQMIRPDITLEMLTVVALILMVRSLEVATIEAAGLAGLVVGLATATKYTGFLAIPALVFSAGGGPGRFGFRVQRVATAAAAVLGAYALASPYSFLDLPGFINGLAEQGRFNTDPSLRAAENMPLFYSSVLAGRGMGPFAFAFSLIGLIQSLRRPERKDGILILFAASYLTFFFAAPVQFDRFMLPCLPVLAIWAARGAQAVWSLVPSPGPFRRGVAAAAIVALLGPSAVRAGLYLRARTQPSPRDAVSDFLRSWAGPDRHSRIAISRLGPLLPDDGYVVGNFVVFNEAAYYALRRFDFLIASEIDSQTVLSRFRRVATFLPLSGGPGHAQTLYAVPPQLRPSDEAIPQAELRLSSAERPERLSLAADGDPRTIWRVRNTDSQGVAVEIDMGRVRRVVQIDLLVPPEGRLALDSLVVEFESPGEVPRRVAPFLLRENGYVRLLVPEVTARSFRLGIPEGTRRTLAIAEVSVQVSRAGAP